MVAFKGFEKIKQIIDKALINNAERKVSVEYWNNELKYQKMKAYIPDIDYEIKKIVKGSKPDIEYKSIRYAFIEY